MELIVVGIDGSEPSHRALRWALEEARLRQAAVEVVHAWHVPYVGGLPFAATSAAALDPAVYEGAARQVLDAALDSQDTAGLAESPTKRLVSGGAATAILDAAKDATWWWSDPAGWVGSASCCWAQ